MSSPLLCNIEAVARRNPYLAQLIEQAPTSSTLTLKRARNGDPVPILRTSGRPTALHSLFDPSREARRLREALTQTQGDGSIARGEAEPGFLLFEGLGAGYQIRPFLDSAGLRAALVVEHDPAHLKGLLSMVDLASVLSDARIRLLLDPTSDELASVIRSTYLPAVMGRFITVPLRPRIRSEPVFFESVTRAVRVALAQTTRDYSVQATFGRLWTRNIVANLSLHSRGTTVVPRPIVEAIVTAAGPSLERQLGELSALRQSRYLIATDTSLPALLACGHLPDAVLTIDCQNFSYQHYLAGIPQTTRLFYELAAPPSVVGLTLNRSPVAGGHPLSLLAASRLPGVPRVDTSGGNVTHAAVSLAMELGARHVHLFGADFSYPFGKPYARGTYLHTYFGERQRRTSTFEGDFTEIMLRNTTLSREPVKGGFRYTTETLLAYRDRLEALLGGEPGRVTPAAGDGLTLTIPSAGDGGESFPSVPSSPAGRSSLSPGGPPSGPTPAAARRFLSEYREAVARLPAGFFPTDSEGGDPQPSPSDSAAVFATLYPVMARLRRDKGVSDVSAAGLLEEARTLVLSMLSRVVQ